MIHDGGCTINSQSRYQTRLRPRYEGGSCLYPARRRALALFLPAVAAERFLRVVVRVARKGTHCEAPFDLASAVPRAARFVRSVEEVLHLKVSRLGYLSRDASKGAGDDATVARRDVRQRRGQASTR